MKKLILNFLKADVRMPQLMFWDWMFPIILVGAFSLFVKSDSFSEFILPGLVSLFVLQSIIFSIPYRIAQFQEQGIFTLIHRKGSAFKLLVGFYLSRVLILLIQLVVVVVMGKLSLGVTLNLNWGALILAFTVSILLFLLLATICGLLAKKQNAALGLAQAIYFYLMGTSGIIYPMDKSPELLQVLSKVSPLYYINQLWTQGLFQSMTSMAADLGVVSIFLAVLLAVILLMVKGKKGRRKYVQHKYPPRIHSNP